VDEAQGFYFAQPLPGDQMLRLVRQRWCGVPVPSAARTRDHRADALPGFGGPRSRLLLAALDASADSVMVTTVGDPSAGLAPHVSYVNAAFERETGYPAADVLGRPWWFSLPNDADGREARAALEEALSTGSATTMTVVNQRADLGLFQCELTVSPITDERGFLTHWMHLRRDLTARRAVEADRDRFQRAIDHTQLAIVFMRPDTTLIYANAAARAMSGLGPQESLEGLRISDLTAPDLVDELRARMLPALARDQRWEGPTVFRHRLTGEQIPLWNDVQVVADPDNPEGSYLAAIAQDRRPELAAAEALEATARRAEHLLSSTGDGVVVLDEMGRLTYANQAAQQLVGLRIEELIGLSAFDLVAAKHVGVALDAFTRQLDRPSDGGDPDLMEVELTAATGRPVPVELVAVRRFDDPAVAGLVVSMRDVTERVERRRELAAMARLERLMTLAAQTATDNTLEEYLAQLDGVLDDFAEALGCDAVYVDRLEGGHVISLSVSTRTGRCFPDSPIPRERLEHWLEALEALGRLVVEDSEAEPAVWMDEQHEVFGRVPRAVLAMPLRSAGQSIAVLGAHVVESARRWERVEVDAFERFGRIVANVLDRYRLSDELARTKAGLLLTDGTGRTAAAAAERRLSHLGLTYAVSRLALHLPSEEFASRLDDVAADIARLIGVPAVAIDVLDSAAGPLQRLGRWPITVDAEPSEREQGWLADLQRLRPVEHDGAEWLASQSYARALAVPMLAAGRLFGALVVADDGDGAWESDERTVLQVVAETVAAALERRQLDSALRASEARFRLLSEEAGDVVGLAAMDGRVMYISPSVTDVLGYGVEEVLGKTVPEFLLSDDLSQLQIHVGDVLHGVRDTFEMRVRKADGTMTWTAVNARAVVDAETGRATEVRFSLRDITDLKRLEAELKRQALHDPLTGLANRALLQTRLQVAAARRNRPNDLALLLIDLDGFKYINDSFGHAVGDEVLRTVAERLAEEGRAGDTLARMGGDEFVLLCPETTLDGAASVAERVVETIGRPIVIDGVTHVVGASVGVAHADGKLPEPDWLLLEADRAMYLAKAAGKGRVRLATTRMPTLD
jgi:diguanylate cyclase (GGDEF)-like protein/PAS domain S-box-containing protein